MNPQTPIPQPYYYPQLYQYQPIYTPFYAPMYMQANYSYQQYTNFPQIPLHGFQQIPDKYVDQPISQQNEIKVEQGTNRNLSGFSEDQDLIKKGGLDQLNLKNRDNLKLQLRKVLEGGNAKHDTLSKLKANNELAFLKILDQLLLKQKSQVKSREELIKYCLRKAIRFVLKKIQDENPSKKLNLKEAQKIFSKKYVDGEQQSLCMPFKRNSKNKTMNTQFLSTIFKSKSFTEVYLEYLQNMEYIIQKDFDKKLEVLTDKIFTHLLQNQSKNVDIKRVPWSKKNIQKVKTLAFELLGNSQDIQETSI